MQLVHWNSPGRGLALPSLARVYQVLGNFKYFWIGGFKRTIILNAEKSVDVWTWTNDDALMIFSDWNPSSPATSNCTGVENNSFWSAVDCNMSIPFVCEMPATNDYNHEYCDDGWAHFTSTHACYKKFSETEKTGQPKAEDFCVQKGGHLASIHSVEENQFIGELTSIGYNTTYGASAFWFGAVRDDNSEYWRWTDITPFDYANWGRNWNYTNCFCAEYWPDSTKNGGNIPMVWNAGACNGYLWSYVCKKESYKS